MSLVLSVTDYRIKKCFILFYTTKSGTLFYTKKGFSSFASTVDFYDLFFICSLLKQKTILEPKRELKFGIFSKQCSQSFCCNRKIAVIEKKESVKIRKFYGQSIDFFLKYCILRNMKDKYDYMK